MNAQPYMIVDWNQNKVIEVRGNAVPTEYRCEPCFPLTERNKRLAEESLARIAHIDAQMLPLAAEERKRQGLPVRIEELEESALSVIEQFEDNADQFADEVEAQQLKAA